MEKKDIPKMAEITLFGLFEFVRRFLSPALRLKPSKVLCTRPYSV